MAQQLEGSSGVDLGASDSVNVATTNPTLPAFGVGGNIFNVPGGLLDQAVSIGADGGSLNPLSGSPPGGFLSGANPFVAPAGGQSINLSFNNQINPFPGVGLDLSLGGISGVNIGGGGGGVVTLPAMIVSGDRLVNAPGIITAPPSIFYGPSDFFDTGAGGGGDTEVVTGTPFYVNEYYITTQSIITTPIISVTPFDPGAAGSEGPYQGTPFVVNASPITTAPTPFTASPVLTPSLNLGTGGAVTMTPMIVTGGPVVSSPTPFTFSPVLTPTLTLSTPQATPAPTPTPSPTFAPPPGPTSGPIFSGGGGGGSTGGGSTTGTMSAQRDFDAELKATLESLRKYQPQIQQMYGDLYSQFMPKGITAAEPGVIGQYQSDLARLQQRQAGMLSPEDVRQSQQAAREAYGARGQVMGPGAVGAEILNREAIRQQREDQARQALQQSYGNVLGMANLQTGNIFQPIGSLMSQTFNPLGAYPADVYGTNVNAQLARDIAQKNYEAAVKSAELSGAAQQKAGTTSAIGQIGSAALPWLLTSIFGCWIAREVYGNDSPKWLRFREWLMSDAPTWFFNFYLKHGEKVAAWLNRNPWAKPAIRLWMDSRIRSMEKHELVLKEAI